jgi:hypothetical protein
LKKLFLDSQNVNYSLNFNLSCRTPHCLAMNGSFRESSFHMAPTQA